MMQLAALELTMFAKGRHPLYPQVRMDTSVCDMRCDAKDPASYGAFHRDAQGVSLTMGSLQARSHGAQSGEDDAMRAVTLATRRGETGEGRATALQDCAAWWNQRKEAARGKLFALRRDDD